jgi:hypothetical protein
MHEKDLIISLALKWIIAAFVLAPPISKPKMIIFNYPDIFRLYHLLIDQGFRH